jgi:glutamine amidotransferase
LTVFDYGAGNLHSLCKALDAGAVRVTIERDPRRCVDTDVLVLPGVGAFAQAASRLERGRAELRDALRDGLPAVGICLGMQLLFERSEEGPGEGIGLIAGDVVGLRAARVPHIGWNSLERSTDDILAQHPVLTAYFANGYVCRPAEASCVTAWSRHEGCVFPAMVRAGRTIGMQFHPEKSSASGVRLLRAAIAAVAA